MSAHHHGRGVVEGMANVADGLRHNFTILPAVDVVGVVTTPLAGSVECAPVEGAPAWGVVLLGAQAASSTTPKATTATRLQDIAPTPHDGLRCVCLLYTSPSP